MRKLKLIYNPNCGDKSFKTHIDSCVEEFQKGGYETHLFRSEIYGDISRHIAQMSSDYEALAIAGGDGSINIAVTAMMRRGLKIPLGLIPCGTANDFAGFLDIPKEPLNAAKVITKGKKTFTDIGFANGSFFINVCGAGYLSDVSQTIDKQWKDTLGKIAYYIKGLEQFPGFSAIPVKITNSREVITEDIFLFIVLNTCGTGGFTKLAPDAKINDGEFEFLAVRALPFLDLSRLIFKIMINDHINDPGLIFFRDNYIKVELTQEISNKSLLVSSLDGEKGPLLPLEIININKAVEIFMP